MLALRSLCVQRNPACRSLENPCFICVHLWLKFLVSNPNSHQPDAVSKLCPACGLCCNGVLFGDVELQRGDDAKKLSKLGMSLRKKKNGMASFNQPCSCFDGKLCSIYDDRPKRCRTFECRLLQRAQTDEVTIPAALKSIAEARRCADDVRKLVRELGQRDEQMPLNRRYSEIMSQPIDLAGDESVGERRGELMMAVHRLTEILERDFLG